jgi:hypothetical protein
MSAALVAKNATMAAMSTTLAMVSLIHFTTWRKLLP